MTIISQRIVPAAVAASLAASMLLAGCSTSQPEAGADAGAPQAEAGQASQAGAVTFTDDTGAEVTVDNPQRVVACMGSFASMWELAGGTLVGASDDAFTTSSRPTCRRWATSPAPTSRPSSPSSPTSSS